MEFNRRQKNLDRIGSLSLCWYLATYFTYILDAASQQPHSCCYLLRKLTVLMHNLSFCSLLILAPGSGLKKVGDWLL